MTDIQTEVKEIVAEPQVQVVQVLKTADGRELTLSDFEVIQAELNRQHLEVKQAKIKAAIQAARERGVAPVILRFVEAMMSNCDLDARPTLQVEDEKFNTFGALVHLLEVVPGRSLEEKTVVVKGEKPPATSTPNDENMTLEEAEEQARQRRAKLGIKPIREAELA